MYKIAAYSAKGSKVLGIRSIQEAKKFLGKYPVLWLDCIYKDKNEVDKLGKLFGFHHLALEDCVTDQRPKIEDYGEYLFIVVKVVEYGKKIEPQQIALFIGKNYIVTVRRKEFRPVDELFNKIQTKNSRILENELGFLCYLILDTVVDSYFPVLDKIEDDIEKIDEEIIKKASRKTLHRIFAIKKDLLVLRKAIWPARDIFITLQHEKIDTKTSMYFRDVYDHVIGVIDLIENYRELIAGALDAYLSTVSNSMNEVMKILTIVASLVLVPTLISGIYGMNFLYMPELEWRYGYPFAIFLMLFTMLVMLLYFKRKKWV